MDLSIFQFSDTAKMPVRNPVTGQPMKTSSGEPVTITLSGRDSELYARVQRESVERRLMDPREVEPSETSADIMARCTVDWNGIQFEGKDLPCDYEHAFSLYKRLSWLREQIDAFISSRGNFTKTSSAS